MQQFGAKAMIQVELHEEEPNEQYLVAFRRKDGSALAFNDTFEKLHTKFLEAAEGKAG